MARRVGRGAAGRFRDRTRRVQAGLSERDTPGVRGHRLGGRVRVELRPGQPRGRTTLRDAAGRRLLLRCGPAGARGRVRNGRRFRPPLRTRLLRGHRSGLRGARGRVPHRGATGLGGHPRRGRVERDRHRTRGEALSATQPHGFRGEVGPRPGVPPRPGEQTQPLGRAQPDRAGPRRGVRRRGRPPPAAHRRGLRLGPDDADPRTARPTRPAGGVLPRGRRPRRPALRRAAVPGRGDHRRRPASAGGFRARRRSGDPARGVVPPAGRVAVAGAAARARPRLHDRLRHGRPAPRAPGAARGAGALAGRHRGGRFPATARGGAAATRTRVGAGLRRHVHRVRHRTRPARRRGAGGTGRGAVQCARRRSGARVAAGTVRGAVRRRVRPSAQPGRRVLARRGGHARGARAVPGRRRPHRR